MRKITLSFFLSITVLAAMALSPSSASAEKNKLVAGGLNFFFPGAGYLYNGDKPLYVSVPILAGSLGLAYVEQIHKFDDGNGGEETLLDHDSTAFGVMFAAIFVANTAFAIDAYQEAGRINERRAGGVAGLRLDVKPITAANGRKQMGLSLSGAF